MSKVMDKVIYKLEMDGFHEVDIPKILNLSELEYERYKEDDTCIRIPDALNMSRLLNKSLDSLFLDTSEDLIKIMSMYSKYLNTFLVIYNDSKQDMKNYPVKTGSIRWEDVSLMDFGQKIELVQGTIMGWSYNQMGKKFQVTGQAIRNWELPNLNVMKRVIEISKKTGVSIDFLLKKEEPLSFTTYNIKTTSIPLLNNYVEIFGNQDE